MHIIFKNLKSIAKRGKDNVVALTVKHLVNHKLAEKAPGVLLQTLEIDSIGKKFTATFSLPEMNKPITIEALGYKITSKNEKHFLEVDEIIKSQEWSNHYIDGKRYKIPSEIVNAVEFIL